ncbi:MAG TPA: hypothetical protein VE085_11575 [Burkholderiales bacterium]|nr:hypothetical protein [Burkholderiales bacterium]
MPSALAGDRSARARRLSRASWLAIGGAWLVAVVLIALWTVA